MDRQDNRTGGGVCIFVREGVQVLDAQEENFVNKSCEQIWVSIKLEYDPPLLVGCIYRPPAQIGSVTTRIMDSCIARSIETASQLLADRVYSSVILLGDFNMPDVEWTDAGTPVLTNIASMSTTIIDAISNSNLVQLVSDSTFISTGQSTNLLDLVLVSDSNRVTEVEIGPPLVTHARRSHCSLRFQHISEKSKSPPFDSRRFVWRKGDYCSMTTHLKNVDWTGILEAETTQSCYSAFLETFGAAAELFVKSRRPRPANPKPPWWNVRIASLVRRKKRLFVGKRANKKSKELADKYKSVCKLVKAVVKQSVIDFEFELAQDAKENPKRLYSYVNRRFAARESIAALKSHDGQLVTDRTSICEHLNQFFQSVFDPPTPRSTVINAINNFPSRSNPDPAFTIEEIFSTPKVLRKLERLSSDKTSGNDKVATHALKMCATALAGPLTHVFKRSLRDSVLPSEWKEANVTPIFKRGSRTEVGNYRPVSLTSVPCKVMESLVKDYILKHLDQRNLLSSKQHGFVAHRACVTNLLETVDYLTDCTSRRHPADIIYLDFAKAFDKVSHELLIVKLMAYGIPVMLVNWIRAFLSNRKQRVVIGDVVSEWKPVTSGVPQGSVLGPLLFVIYINDLPEICRSTCKLYADDTKLMSSVKTADDTSKLQQDLDELLEWSNRWKMSFNDEKCVVMHIGADNKHHDYTMNGRTLCKTTKERDLGIFITSDLKSGEQSKRAAARGTMVAYRIKNTFKFFTRPLVDLLYKSFVRPHLEFAVGAWNPYRRGDVEVLERVQRKFSKLVPELKSRPYEERREALGWTTLEDRRRRGDLIQLHKIHHGHDRVEFVHGNQLLASSHLDSPAGHTRRGQQSIERQLVRNCGVRHNFFTNRTAGNWNVLDTATRSIRNTNTFKNRIDKLLGFC